MSVLSQIVVWAGRYRASLVALALVRIAFVAALLQVLASVEEADPPVDLWLLLAAYSATEAVAFWFASAGTYRHARAASDHLARIDTEVEEKRKAAEAEREKAAWEEKNRADNGADDDSAICLTGPEDGGRLPAPLGLGLAAPREEGHE